MRRLLCVLLLVGCGPATNTGTTDAGPCQDATPSGVVLVGPSGSRQPSSCLDGQTGAWVTVRYASDFQAGRDFVKVGAVVSLGHDSNGAFVVDRDFTSDKEVSASTPLPTNIWIDLSAVQDASRYQIKVFTQDGAFFTSGHDLPVEDLASGSVKHFDIPLGKP